VKIIYKIILGIIFNFFYGKVKISFIKKKNKSVNIKKINFFSKSFTLYEMDNARIFTDCNTNVAYISSANEILPQISFQQNKDRISKVSHNSVLKFGTPKLKYKISGVVFSLVQGASGNNYWHWLFDLLPKIEILHRNNMLKHIDYYYVPNLNPYVVDTLKVYGINKFQLINSQKLKHITAKKIIAIENIYFKKGFFQKQFENIPKFLIISLNDRFKEFISSKKSSKKIFIDRSDSKFKHFQLANNKEIINKLKQKNYSIVKLSKLSFFEQISLFYNSKMIIGVHGAGFANLAFCKSRTKVYEILSEKTKKRNAIKTICKHKKLFHKKVIAKEVMLKDRIKKLFLDVSQIKI